MGDTSSKFDEPVFVGAGGDFRLDTDSREVLRILNTGGGLVNYLGKESKLCKYFDDGTIQLKFFAGGASGQVADITFPGMGTRRYVVKAGRALKEVTVTPPARFGTNPTYPLQYIWDQIAQTDGNLSYDVFIEMNGGDPARKFGPGEKIYLPTFAEMCITSKPSTFKRTDGKGVITFPAKSYICDQNEYSEYVNSLLAGELMRSGLSINFINTFNFATCAKNPPPKVYRQRLEEIGEYDEDEDDLDEQGVQYTFMEKVDGSMDNLLNEGIQAGEAARIFVQIVHAIAMYQLNFKTVHGDLHPGNVFYSKVTDDLEWKGRKVKDVDYFSYKVSDGRVLNLLPTSIIPKVADWGLSVKYSAPVVADKRTLKDGYNQGDGNGPWLPNFYNEVYDIFVIFFGFYVKHSSYQWFKDVKEWFIGPGSSMKDYFTKVNRPILNLLEVEPLKNKTPLAFLNNDVLMAPFLVNIPPGETSITLGELKLLPEYGQPALPSTPAPPRPVDVVATTGTVVSTSAAKAKSSKKSPKSKTSTASKTTSSATKSKSKLSQPEQATLIIAPSDLDCTGLGALGVVPLQQRLRPLGLSNATMNLLVEKRITGNVLIDYYEVYGLDNLNLPTSDHLKLTTYLGRCV